MQPPRAPNWRQTRQRVACDRSPSSVLGLLGARHRGAARLSADGPARQIFSARRAPAAADTGGSGQARRHPRPPRPRAGDERRRRLDLRRAVRDRRQRAGGRIALCEALARLHGPRAAAAARAASTASAPSPTSAGRSRPTGARASPPSISRASASSRRAAASIRTRSWPRMLLGYVGIDNNGLSGIESAYDSQIRGKDGTVLVTTDAAATCSAASSGRRRPARRSS